MDDSNDLVLERTFNAPRDLVWRALTDPEQMKRWWAPRPYQTPEVEIDLRPGGIFRTRMTGPDGFNEDGAGCVLEVVEGEKIVWTSALLPGYRPPAEDPADCGGFPFTAVLTFEDAGEGRTRYRAVALHRNEAERASHEQMGFQEGWGTCADQLGAVAAELGKQA
jgi:uncharacterized protein YndB with AHSA1/START domain